MTKWHYAKEAPNLYEWIVAEWYDSDEKEYKYETDFGTPSVNWDEYVKRNNITKWCYIKDIKDYAYETEVENDMANPPRQTGCSNNRKLRKTIL